ERGQDRAALVVAIGVDSAAPQLLEACGDLVQIGAHLLDLGVDRAALLRSPIEQREEPGTVAALALGLTSDAIELGLLPGGGVLVTADLLVLGRIAVRPAVDGGKLRFKPWADRIDGRARSGRRRWSGRRRIHLGRRGHAEADAGKQRGAGQNLSQ